MASDQIMGIDSSLISRIIVGLLIWGTCFIIPTGPHKREDGSLDIANVFSNAIAFLMLFIAIVFIGSALEEITGAPIGTP